MKGGRQLWPEGGLGLNLAAKMSSGEGRTKLGTGSQNRSGRHKMAANTGPGPNLTAKLSLGDSIVGRAYFGMTGHAIISR